jgi:hypothetical protein
MTPCRATAETRSEVDLLASETHRLVLSLRQYGLLALPSDVE